VVGQKVEVRNAYYDTHEEAVTNHRKAHEAELIHSGEVDVYEMMNDLIAAGDQEGIDYLLELINAEHPIELVDFKEDPRLEVAVRYFYYDESDESKFEQKIVGDETIFSLPSFKVSEVAKEQMKAEKEVDVDPSIMSLKTKIYFAADKSTLEQKYHTRLDKFLRILEENSNLGIEISGFASPDGNEEYNRELSNKRAIEVLEYLNHRGIVRRRIVAKGYGETTSEALSKEESRRVEVKIVVLDGYARTPVSP
jgi:outer membrane protein OmpA-like peptidoglycan-associated protein